MGNYARLMFASLCTVSSIIAAALAQLMPGWAAAAYATLIALLWGHYNDPVSKHFRTDIERILEPNDAMKFVGFGVVIMGMLAAAAAAAVTGNVILAAPCGIVTAFLFVTLVF